MQHDAATFKMVATELGPYLELREIHVKSLRKEVRFISSGKVPCRYGCTRTVAWGELNSSGASLSSLLHFEL